MRLDDQAPVAGSRPEQTNHNDGRRLQQHKQQQQRSAEPANAMAAAFAKLKR